MIRRLLLTCLGVLAGCGIGSGVWYRQEVLADPGEAFSREAILAIIAQESPIYYRDGVTPLGVFFDQEHRKYVPYAELPQDWIEAIVASEDGNFFRHPGIDPKHIARALWQNIRAGEVVAGGSTLTQQTAKNLFYRPDRSFKSKVNELGIALRLEAWFSKEDILEFYANQFHVSANGRGLGIAARYFFNKTPGQLSTKECAFIAGMVKAPSRYNPFIGESEERRAEAVQKGEARTSYVLGRMLEEGYLDPKERDRIQAEPLRFSRGTFQYDRSVLVDEVQRRLEEPTFLDLFEKLGIDNPSTAGIQVITTVDATVQRESTYALWHHLTELGSFLERAEPATFHLPANTARVMAPATPLVPHEFAVARVLSVGESLALDVGGRACTVDAEGMNRIATLLRRAKSGQSTAKTQPADVEALPAAFPEGTLLFVSVRDSANCDIELRPELQGGVVVLDEGEVVAMVGGNDNRNFNRVTGATRQFGSTWKPLVYEAAFQLGWLPTDILDNRRNVFPFRDVWYYPSPDHASESFLPLTTVGARSENLASVWLLYHLTDRVNPEQFRRLATLVDLARREDEAPSDYVRRMVDKEAIRSNPERFEEYAFTLARQDVLSGIAFSAHPDDALAVRSLLHGRGFSPELAKKEATARGADRDARIGALGNNLLAVEELASRCLAGEPGLLAADPNGVLACGRTPPGYTPLAGPPFVPPEDFLVDGRIHLSTVRALRGAVDVRLAEIQGRDPWEPDMLALNPDFRVLVGVRYLTALVGAFGVDAALPSVLSLPLGAADLRLVDAAVLYQGMWRGERYRFGGTGLGDGTVTGLRASFELPDSHDPVSLISEIRDASGNVLYRGRVTPERVADPVAGAMTGEVLRNVVRMGTGRRAEGAIQLGGAPVPLGGKTGTTNDYRNAAFVGLVPSGSGGELTWGTGFTVAAYVGYDDNRSMRRGGFRVQGANGALPVWLGAVRGLAAASLLGPGGSSVVVPPEGLARVPVDAGLPESPSALVPVGVPPPRRFAPFTEPASLASASMADVSPSLTPPAPGDPLSAPLPEEGAAEPVVIPEVPVAPR